MAVTVIGLGAMGFGMAASLVESGIKTYGLDMSKERVAQFVAMGGLDGEASDCAAETELLMLVVVNAAQMRGILFGEEGWVNRLKPRSIVMGCATIAPSVAREIAQEVEAAGLVYLDAPISGGAVKARAGQLTIMASGAAETFERIAPELSAVAATVHRLGDTAGQGSAMKAVNQLLAGVHIAAMGEALALAKTQGLELDLVREVIGGSAGASWMFENRAAHVIAQDYTPLSAMTIWPKDLGIVDGIATEAGLNLSVTTTALSQYVQAIEQGMGALDDAAITEFYLAQVGLERIQVPQEGAK